MHKLVFSQRAVAGDLLKVLLEEIEAGGEGNQRESDKLPQHN